MKWTVYICPYTLMISGVLAYIETDLSSDPFYTTVSGSFSIIVEADSVEGAKVAAWEKLIPKRIKDLQETIQSEKANSERLNRLLMELHSDIRRYGGAIRKILREGELNIFDSGKNIYFKRYMSGNMCGVTALREIPSSCSWKELIEKLAGATLQQEDEY
jgi:hypothetical protein